MPSLEELADEYAGRLRNAGSSVTKSLTKTAQAQTGFATAVRKVLAEVDGLTSGGRPISTTTRSDLFAALDGQLRLERGTFERIKKGSVENSIEFDKYVAYLMQQIQVED